MLLDELVQKGWGLGSGISLFIMAGVAQNVLWSTFSPSGTGLFVGALSSLLAPAETTHYQLGSLVVGRNQDSSITNRFHSHHRSVPDNNLSKRCPN